MRGQEGIPTEMAKEITYEQCKFTLSYDVVSGSEITPCKKININHLVVHRFSGNVMMSITMLHT